MVLHILFYQIYLLMLLLTMVLLLQQTRFQAMSESIVTKNILFICRLRIVSRLLVFSIFVEIYAIQKINNLPRRLLGLV